MSARHVTFYKVIDEYAAEKLPFTGFAQTPDKYGNARGRYIATISFTELTTIAGKKRRVIGEAAFAVMYFLNTPDKFCPRCGRKYDHFPGGCTYLATDADFDGYQYASSDMVYTSDSREDSQIFGWLMNKMQDGYFAVNFDYLFSALELGGEEEC